MAEFRLDNSMRLLREQRWPTSILLVEVDSARGGLDLEGAASCLQQNLRSDDFVGHWSADILICIFPNCRLSSASHIASRCLDRASLSGGVTELRLAERPADAVDRAIQLMRKSRALGGNRVCAG